MELLDPYPDGESIAAAILSHEGPVVKHRPSQLTPPLIQVGVVGSTEDGVTETVRVEVQTFAGTLSGTLQLAKACQQRILASPGLSFAGHCVDRARTDAGPRVVDYGNPAVKRTVASYVISYRR